MNIERPAMTTNVELVNARNYLRENVEREHRTFWGITDANRIEQVTDNIFDETRNHDGRWPIIKDRMPPPAKVLDVGTGCGNFVLFGLCNGYDAWGVDPEEWKRDYFRRKISASNYPEWYLDRLVEGVSESLPFESESFDLVTIWATLQSVQDVGRSIQEMVRVLKPGGVLFLRTPAANSFFEPIYRVPFVPLFSKRLHYKVFSAYLRLLGRPTLAAESIQWFTEKDIAEFLRKSNYSLKVEPTSHYYYTVRPEKIQALLPKPLKNSYIVNLLNVAYQTKLRIQKLLLVGRSSRYIDLWIQRIG